MAEWQDEPLDKRSVCQKRRRTAKCLPQAPDMLPGEWRELLARWVQRGNSSRWETLKKTAGTNRVALADSLLDWLLANGWVAVNEQWKLGAWWPQQVEWLHLSELRVALGLRDRDNDVERWQEIRAALQMLEQAALSDAALALDELPLQRALARSDLVFKLHHWQLQQRSGTRRDFALFARGDTKSLSDSEWNWLESVLDLAEFGIERHTPLLLLAAPLTLTSARGQFDLASCADFAALTPSTIEAVTAATGQVSRWILVENRTSFERVARQREADVGVIWLPGFPPSWWRIAVGQLLATAPAPALIACDPDPAGVAIALKAAELWEERKLTWQPWKMSASDLAALRSRKTLTEGDRQQLAALQQTPALPDTLRELLQWMLDHGEKGEQEGYL